LQYWEPSGCCGAPAYRNDPSGLEVVFVAEASLEARASSRKDLRAGLRSEGPDADSPVISSMPHLRTCLGRAGAAKTWARIRHVRLALKLALAILPGAMVIIAAAAVLDLQRDRADFDADQRADDLAIVRILAEGVSDVWETGGEARAKAVLTDAHYLESRFRLRWVDLRTVTAALSVTEREAVERGDEMLWHPVGGSPRWLHALSPIRVHGAVVGAIDLSEPPTDLRAHVWKTIRATVVTTLALSASMLLVTLVIGAWVVGRPVSALIEQARRVAAGDLRARATPRQHDELGELTHEFNKMCDRLEAASAEVRASTRQRFATLEQLRHAERLSTVGRLASSVAHELAPYCGGGA
jgi:two-component system NtrC family sensor kinase